MKKIKTSALLITAVIAVISATGCSNTTKTTSSTSESSAYVYADDPEVGQNTVDVELNEDTQVNDTVFKLNGVIDSGRVKDGLKYIYLDVSITNESDTDYELNGLNNFYLLLDTGVEIHTDVRADLYAKQALTGYEALLTVPAHSEYNNYVGFCLDESIDSFTVGFFPTETTDDKSNVVLCEIKPEDIQAAPDGMFVDIDSTTEAE
jgi:hypothetical protein